MNYPLTVAEVELLAGKFTDGDPLTGVARSLLPAEAMNALHDEIIAVIVAAALTPTEGSNAQLLAALHVLFTTPAQALLKASNLSDLANVATTRTNLGAASAGGLATLDGGGKVPVGQLPASILGALIYQGSWNANTNSPTLTSGVGTKGFYYKVGTAGTTAVDGNAVWNVGDLITFDGTTWDKFDGTTDEVITFNGRYGVVTLTGADVDTALGYTPVNPSALGTAAAHNTGDFDAAGAAATAQTNSQAYALALLANLGVNVNFKPLTLTGSFSDSVGITLTAPAKGLFIAISAINFATVGATGSSTTAALSITGGSSGTDSTQLPSVQFAGVTVAATNVVTATLAVTTGGTSPATTATARIIVIFIPTN